MDASVQDDLPRKCPYRDAVNDLTWGTYLRQARVARGLTQVDLAAAAGVSEATIINQERHGQAPGRDTLVGIVQALDIPIMAALALLYDLDHAVEDPRPVELVRLDELWRRMTSPEYTATERVARRDAAELLAHVAMVTEWGEARADRTARRRTG
jgi:transcriptional regulator with XRE-family HTH domain